MVRCICNVLSIYIYIYNLVPNRVVNLSGKTRVNNLAGNCVVLFEVEKVRNRSVPIIFYRFLLIF